MTYKNAISIFESRYRELSFGKSMPDLTRFEIMFKLSVIQANLNSTYKICKKQTYLNLQAGESRYTPADFAYSGDIIFWDMVDFVVSNGAVLNNGTYKLDKMSLEDMQSTPKISGYPQRYSVFNESTDQTAIYFEIDTIPALSYADDSTYRLNITHVWKTGLFEGAVTPGIFQDYNEASAGFGGSFLIPPQWDSALIEGALASVFPELQPLYNQYVQQALQSTPILSDWKLNYFFGFK